MSALVVPQEDIFLEFTKWEMILALFYSNKRIGLVKTCCSSKKLLLSTPWHKKKKKKGFGYQKWLWDEIYVLFAV